jgi:hypothetical protein
MTKHFFLDEVMGVHDRHMDDNPPGYHFSNGRKLHGQHEVIIREKAPRMQRKAKFGILTENTEDDSADKEPTK